MRLKALNFFGAFGGGETCAQGAYGACCFLVVAKCHAPRGRWRGGGFQWWLNSMRPPGVFSAFLPPGG